jgi:hypothetical protein
MKIEQRTPEEQTQADYELEWTLAEDDSPQKPGVAHLDEGRETGKEAPRPTEPAQAVNTDTTDGEIKSKAGEPEPDDAFAGWSEEQLAVYKKTESDVKAMKGRHRLAQDRIKDLEAKLKAEAEERRKLAAQARPPTRFEQDHPEYADDLKQLFTGADKDEPIVDTGNSEYEQADLILAAHPDAGTVYNDPAFQQWLSTQSPSVIKSVDSSFAGDVIPVLDLYAAHSRQATDKSRQDALRDVSDVGGSSGQHRIRNTSNMTAQELYELEWENDEI